MTTGERKREKSIVRQQTPGQFSGCDKNQEKELAIVTCNPLTQKMGARNKRQREKKGKEKG